MFGIWGKSRGITYLRNPGQVQKFIVNKFYENTAIEAFHVHFRHTHNERKYDFLERPDFKPGISTSTSCSVRSFKPDQSSSGVHHSESEFRKNPSHDKWDGTQVGLKMEWYQYPGEFRQSRDESWLIILVTPDIVIDADAHATRLKLEYQYVSHGRNYGWMISHDKEITRNGFIFLNGLKVPNAVIGSTLPYEYNQSAEWDGNVSMQCTLAKGHFESLCYPQDFNTSQWEFPKGKDCNTKEPAGLSELFVGKQPLQPTHDDDVGSVVFDITSLVRNGFRLFRVFTSMDNSANPEHAYNFSVAPRRRLTGGPDFVTTPSIVIRTWEFINV